MTSLRSIAKRDQQTGQTDKSNHYTRTQKKVARVGQAGMKLTLMTFPRKSWLVLSIKTGGITLIDFNPEGALVLKKQTPNLSVGYWVVVHLEAINCMGLFGGVGGNDPLIPHLTHSNNCL